MSFAIMACIFFLAIIALCVIIIRSYGDGNFKDGLYRELLMSFNKNPQNLKYDGKLLDKEPYSSGLFDFVLQEDLFIEFISTLGKGVPTKYHIMFNKGERINLLKLSLDPRQNLLLAEACVPFKHLGHNFYWVVKFGKIQSELKDEVIVPKIQYSIDICLDMEAELDDFDFELSKIRQSPELSRTQKLKSVADKMIQNAMNKPVKKYSNIKFDPREF